MIASLALAASTQVLMGRCTISFQADRDLKSVSAAGAFNGWNLSATPLRANGRKWTVTLDLPVGRYPYKLVLDGKDWILDPGNPHREDGGNVDFNSLLTVYPDGYDVPAVLGDGKITPSVVEHRSEPKYITVDRGRLILSVRVRPGDVRKVEAVVNGQSYPMTPAAQDDLFEIVRAQVPLQGKSLTYGFRLTDGSQSRWLGPQGLSVGSQGAAFKIARAKIPTVNVPTWAERTVMYEIFPDRFANGNKANDPPKTQPWGDKPDFNRFQGGDSAGVKAHIDYLAKLGIGGIYFTPVFQSPANHRYLTQDFYKIDPPFATETEFSALTAALRDRGIRTILDGVFSCTGTDFFAFQDILKNQQASKYRDWYTVHSYPVKLEGMPTYAAWGGYGGLPLVNLKNPGLREHLLGVAPYWDKRATLSGWRLDSSERLTPEFCRAFRKRAKDADPQGWIVGEIWTDASQYLQGDMFDSVMGYQFRDAAVSLVAKSSIKPSEFMSKLMMTYTSYPPQVSRNLMSLLGSHDTPRFLTLCNGDKDLAIMGAAFQLSWPGTPCIYYGDELGMEGGSDPDNRRAMRWDLTKDSNPILSAYRKLIRARRENEVLQVGEPVPLIANDATGVVAYARVLGRKVAVVVANTSGEARNVSLSLPVPSGSFKDVLSGKSLRVKAGRAETSVAAKGVQVFVAP